MMIVYFLLFTALGIFFGKATESDPKMGVGWIIAIAVFWGYVSEPIWGAGGLGRDAAWLCDRHRDHGQEARTEIKWGERLMARHSRDLPRWTDPFPEIEAECLDDNGQLDPDRIKMALRLAYRKGFQACNDIYRGALPIDLQCPVPYPRFPSRESERLAAQAAVEELLKHPPKGGRKAS